MSEIDMSGWSAEQKAEYASIMESFAEESGKNDVAEAKREAERLSPENQLVEKRLELAAKKKAAALAVSELQADIAFRKAIQEHGGKERVSRIFTEGGSIIMRAMTLAESDEYSVTAEGLTDVGDKMRIAREALIPTVLYPSKEVFLGIQEKYPNIWLFLYLARDAMTAGIKEDSAKKG